MTNIASHTTAYDDNDRSSGINIAKSDKKMMNLEKELKLKKNN